MRKGGGMGGGKADMTEAEMSILKDMVTLVQVRKKEKT
jgi:hypothetical protein